MTPAGLTASDARIVTRNDPVATLPDESRAEQLTCVSPTGNREPAAGSHVTTGEGIKRDASLWKKGPEHEKVILNRLGWLDAPQWLESKTRELIAFAAGVRAEGFTRVQLMATLSGEPLYRVCGYQEIERTAAAPVNGVAVPLILMGKQIGL